MTRVIQPDASHHRCDDRQIKLAPFLTAHLTRYIGTACGYMEQYVEEEGALQKLREGRG